MINSYLKELVQDNRRVIIPDFGAFLKKDKNAAAAADPVIFSPFLRFNDGLLEGYLVEKKRITKEEASAAVRQYVQDVKQTISKQKPYYVEDLGVFYEDERGSVQFLYAETEKEALGKFEKAIAAARVNTPTFMPELEVKTPVAVQELVEPAAEATAAVEKKKPTRKKAAAAVEAENNEEDDAADKTEEVVKRGQKKTVKRVAKAGKAVAKTIINVNVTNEKSKEEQLSEAAKNLEGWIAAREKRKGEPANDEKNEPLSEEEKEKQQHRAAEIERALAKKRIDEERAREAALSAKTVDEEWRNKRQSPPAVWEDVEVVRHKRGGRGAGVLLVMMLLVLAGVGALWFWEDISELLGMDSERDIIELIEDELVPSAPAAATPAPRAVSTPFTPAVSAQQPGMYYVVIGSFNHQHIKEMMGICQSLYDAGFTSEVVKTGSNFSISVGKFNNRNDARSRLTSYSQKFGKKYGAVSIVP